MRNSAIWIEKSPPPQKAAVTVVAGACPKLPSRKALRPQGPGVKPGANLVAPFWLYGNSRAGVYQRLLRICNGHIVSVAAADRGELLRSCLTDCASGPNDQRAPGAARPKQRASDA